MAKLLPLQALNHGVQVSYNGCNSKILKGITIFGKGVIDGQGSAWWNDYGRMPSTKPTVATLTCALLFTMF